MLRPDILTVKPVGQPDQVQRAAPAGDARQEAFERSLAGLLGKTVKGEVLSRLTDGSYLVRVNDNSARLLLPQGTQVGAEVPLTLVATTPRPTFQISTETPGAAPRFAYTEAGPALLPGPEGAAARAVPLVYLEGSAVPLRAPTPGAANPEAPVQANVAAQADTAEAAAGTPAEAAQSTASAAAGLAKDAAALAGARPQSTAAALLSKAPLVPADQLPEIDPKSTPAQISEAAKAITTVLTAAQTAKPQTAIVSRLPLLPSPDVAPEQVAHALKETVSKSGLFYESHVKEWSEGQRPIIELSQEPQMRQASAPEPGAPPKAGNPTDPATAQFINLQLTTQEQGRVAWQGQVWPGQQMQWEIQRDAPEGRGQGKDGEPEAVWRSGVRFSFPALGEIAATVTIVGDQLHINVQAGSNGVGELLREHAGELAGALEAAGSPLSSLNIRAGAVDG